MWFKLFCFHMEAERAFFTLLVWALMCETSSRRVLDKFVQSHKRLRLVMSGTEKYDFIRKSGCWGSETFHTQHFVSTKLLRIRLQMFWWAAIEKFSFSCQRYKIFDISDSISFKLLLKVTTLFEQFVKHNTFYCSLCKWKRLLVSCNNNGTIYPFANTLTQHEAMEIHLALESR